MPTPRKAARIPAAAALLALALTGTGSGAAEAATCPNNGYHYYATAHSGSGNYGTGAEELTWNTWSFDGHGSADHPFSDEAVWTMDNNNANDSLEVGFATGYVKETGGFDGGIMFPYYTLNLGNIEYDFTGTSLPKNTYIWNSATSNGTDSWAYVNDRLLSEIAYDVPQPRYSFEQTEVNYHDITMGGGGGSTVTAEWQNGSQQWNDWAYIDGDTAFEKPDSGDPSSPAGYGYFIDLTQPNGAVQGGTGKAC
jgi:hypothetical protein